MPRSTNSTSVRYQWGAVKTHCRNVRTNTAESFNVWVPAFHLLFNGMQPQPHKPWVRQAFRFYDDNLGDVPVRIRRRPNVVAQGLKKKPTWERNGGIFQIKAPCQSTLTTNHINHHHQHRNNDTSRSGIMYSKALS